MKKSMIKFTMMAIVAVMGLALTSCGASKTVSVTDADSKSKIGYVPEVEVTFPCSGIDSDEDYFRVNGNGSSKDRMMARDRAYQAALANLSTKLAGVASSSNSRVAVSTNAETEDFHDKMVAVSKIVSKANVAGYRTSCEKFTVNPETGAYTCYVTIEFGKKELVKQLYENLNNQKLLKADYDFDRYLEMFDKDLKAYEEAHQ